MEKDFYQDLQKKSKKKKHHRSRSRSQKKHKRSRSRSQRKKDKKKKDKQYEKQNNRSHSKQKQRQAEKQKDLTQQNKPKQQDVSITKQTTQKQKKNRQNEKDQESYKRREKDRQSRQRDPKKDKYRQRSDRQYRDRDYKDDSKLRSQKQRYVKGQLINQQRSKSKSKQRRKQKDRERQRDRDRARQRQRQRDRYRERSKDKQRQRSKDKQRQRSKDRERQRQRGRQRSRQVQKPSSSRNLQRHQSSRRSRTPQRRRQRQQQQRQFDSPPKSDQSDISDDPQKMQKLNRTKAEQQLVTSKADKKLYLGNLPPNITSQQLMDMLNVALKKMEINTDVDGDSIISAWISPDGVGHYAFVEFRTAQQATNGLALNGASLFGYQLKLGRPKQYIEYNKQMLSKFGTDSSIDTILKKVQAIGGQIQIQVCEKIIHPPSRIIVLKHIVTVDQLAIDEQYQQIFDDVKDMAKRFGDVLKIIIPRPHEVIDLQQVQKRVKGLGYIFIQYRTIQQAIFARKQFIQKQFSSRSVACGYFDQKRWLEGELDICEKVVIQF